MGRCGEDWDARVVLCVGQWGSDASAGHELLGTNKWHCGHGFGMMISRRSRWIDDLFDL